jgi:predicted GIY-YIG superfamily endonuclease
MSSISASDSESQPPLEVLIMAPSFICDTSMPAGSIAELIMTLPLPKHPDARNVLALLLTCELKRKKPARQKEENFHHNVYVVLLSDAVAKHPSILRLNPKRDPLQPCVYVGMTGIPVDHRFENHKNGYKSAWVVRKYGVRLMPELYEHLNPMPFEAALQMETELAEDLRASGYTVTGGH